MTRRIVMYFAWDRAAESNAPLGELDNRFPVRSPAPVLALVRPIDGSGGRTRDRTLDLSRVKGTLSR
jgi:hypothetical protein